MISKRIAFVSAISFAVLALFVLHSAEAASPVINNPYIDPADSRVDGSLPMSFGVEYSDEDGDFPSSFIVYFEGVSTEADMECLSSGCIDGTNPNGTWMVVDLTQPLANTLVANVGSDEISYNFVAVTSGEDDACYLSCDAWIDSNVRVNTIPVLTDDATVTGGGMPEDTYTLSITYTDEDGHTGAISATVCETSNSSSCDTPLSLSKSSGDESTGAVYSIDFETGLGGALTVTVSGGDGFDDAEDSRTTTFSVDTETPWLKNPSVSPTSTGVAGNVSFSIVYCVFDADMGTPTVEVTVGSASTQAMSAGANNSACNNGVDYSLTTTVAWAAAAQSVTFSASNDAGSAANVAGSSVTINDAPTLSSGSAERDADNFILNVSAADINSDDGDSISVFATIEFDTERAMSCDGGGICTVTVAEADIISQRGGTRSVTFRVQDLHTVSTGGDFGNSIDVTRTSSFILSGPGDQTPQPGSSDYTFTVENNGNSEDTFSISASSLNNWVSTSSDSSVTVAYASSETFTITMDVPHVAAGTTDSWSVDVTAGNDGTHTGNDGGTTTVAVVSGHTVTIADSSSNADPGATITYYFTITNTGNADESFAYTTSGNPDSGFTALGMGDSETVAVSHTIASASAAGDQSTVTFTSGSESATATTTANQIYGVTISLQSTTDQGGISPGETFNAVYTVTNTGNGGDTVTIDFNADWLTGASGTTHSLAGFGGTGTATATLKAPGDAASDSSSSITAFATGSSSSGDSGPTSLDVASNSRSVSLSPGSSYTINQGSSGTGTVTVTNGGVAATFTVISMSPSLSFANSEIILGATGTIGGSRDLTFTINAAESGDFTFTIADAIDDSSATYTGTVVARVFDASTLTSSTDDCGSAGVVCETELGGGWDGNGYANSGTWSTTKTMTDSNGQSGTVTFDTTVPNAAPTVISLSAENGVVAGEPRTFIFMVPSDSDGTISHFVIAFGDGNFETFEASDMTGSTVASTHTYESAGEFSLTATAYDNSGDYTIQAVTVNVAERTVALDGPSYTYNLVALVGFFVLGMLLAGTAFKMQQGEIAGDEEMNERDRQRLESVERRMEGLAEREELLEVSAYDASRAATKLEEHISAFNEVLVRAQEIAAEEKLQELEAAEAAREKEEEQTQLDLEDPDIEMVAERFHDSLGRLVKARDELSKIEEQLAHILKMERDEQLEKLTSMTDEYESTKRKIDALQSTKEARDATADESSIMNLLSAAASGTGASDFGGFDDLGDSDEYEVEIYEDEDGSFYYIDPDTGEEVPCDEDGNAL
jgi:NACalpha-BTF3-like transcription factor